MILVLSFFSLHIIFFFLLDGQRKGKGPKLNSSCVITNKLSLSSKAQKEMVLLFKAGF